MVEIKNIPYYVFVPYPFLWAGVSDVFHQLRVWLVLTSVGSSPSMLARLARGSLDLRGAAVPLGHLEGRYGGHFLSISPCTPCRPNNLHHHLQLGLHERMSASGALSALKFSAGWNPAKTHLSALSLHHRTTGQWKPTPDWGLHEQFWGQMFSRQASSTLPTSPCPVWTQLIQRPSCNWGRDYASFPLFEAQP